MNGAIHANHHHSQPPRCPVAPRRSSRDPDSWGDWDNKFRVIYTPERRVSGHECNLHGSAVQFPDGHVIHPGVWIAFNQSIALTTAQAREFAALIVTTADEVDGWAGR
jgi:hypothetical protein